MAESTQRRGKLKWFGYGVVVLLAAAVAALTLALQQNIAQRKREATATVFKIVDIDEKTIDPQVWGKNFPRQYDGYKRTVDIARTKYGGSDSFSKLDQDPRWRSIFAGYAFSIDYREDRGHAYMLSDQRETERVTKRPQPGACLQCHASNIVAYREVGLKSGAPGTGDEPLFSSDGQAQLFKGFEEVCAMPYNDATKLVSHPVSCLDCHDPATMTLRVTRPAFLTGIRALAAGADPVPHLPSIERWRKGDRARPYDPNIDASRQEMRSMACGQCHVEYYFKGDHKLLTYPWANGLKMDQIEKYYDDMGFKDWTHEQTGAPVLKAQHPEFETWSQGIHARSGVACADCHMPYKREGAIKVSDHHVRSPLLNIARACQVCHNYPESEILARVTAIQDRNHALLDRTTAAVIDMINTIEAAKKAGATDDELAPARALHRKAQWRLDFVAAENSMGFHAPQESARILGEAIDYSRQAELAIAKLGKGTLPLVTPPTPAPKGTAAK
jgi:nitrite reductase (cytochrome c-552)